MEKKTLAKLGYRFDANELDPWEVEAFTLIESTINEEKNKDLNKKARKR